MYKIYSMRRIFTKIILVILLLPLIGFSQSKSQAFEISKNLDIYATLFKELSNNYVEEINPGDLNTTALEAMLNTLDPYTIYIPESRIEEMKFLTTGEYGGIGVSVMKRDGRVVIAAIEDKSPAIEAGFITGDEIISIDGQNLDDRTDEEIGVLLKGQPGTPIVVRIKRFGLDDIQEIEVLRRKLNIDNIPYYGMLDSIIGYVSLSSFTKGAAQNMGKAFNEMKQQNAKALIIDLRGNGGGLIGEAVDIMNLFVSKDEEIVRTKGRLRDKNFIYKTRKEAMDLNIPLVILVDRNSASASEIVCGSAQDLDRAVIIGERTYGKGLVQNVIPLSFNSQLKVTIAKYYIPSGRCIQAIDYSHKDQEGNALKVNDSLLETFYTRKGRTVHDGRGIKPDVLFSPTELSEITATLLQKYMIFDFATQYRLSHDSILAPDQFVITGQIWEDFIGFLSDKDISYQSDLEKSLEKLKKEMEESGLTDDMSQICLQIQDKINQKKENELELHKEEISRVLKTELVSRYYFNRGIIIANLYEDKAIEKAMDVLKDETVYKEILEAIK